MDSWELERQRAAEQMHQQFLRDHRGIGLGSALGAAPYVRGVIAPGGPGAVFECDSPSAVTDAAWTWNRREGVKPGELTVADTGSGTITRKEACESQPFTSYNRPTFTRRSFREELQAETDEWLRGI